MIKVLNTPDLGQSHRLRLNTLVRLRWLAIVGQSVTVVDRRLRAAASRCRSAPCFALIACSAGLNLYPHLALSVHASAAARSAAFAILTFDALQLAGLLYMTGGLTNPFSLLMAVPVVISATSLPLRMTALLGALVMAMATRARLPPPAAALVSTARGCRCRSSMSPAPGWRCLRRSPSPASTPSASPRKRGCSPTRCRRPNSCCSASSISPRSTAWRPPPRTSSARRLPRSRWSPARWSARWATTRVHAEDVTLLRSQSERCREILKRLTSLSTEGEAHLARLPLTSLIEEVTAPHRDFGIAIKLEPGERHRPGAGRAPQSRRHLRARQSGRERRRFRHEARHRALALERRGGRLRRSSTTARAFRRRSSTASASPICRPARARSAAAGWGSACSSPRRCWSARAPPCPSATANDAGRGRAWCEIAWPRAAFLSRAGAERHVRHRCDCGAKLDIAGSPNLFEGRTRQRTEG